eukprot:TRINITY_DN17146_c0_g1_i1.p1 TRINITY_DN17146_c0_g1~~TRINITY_DN17146_c0_g1_i1.p1  ORF type:complete len:512 (+),score=98.25 TRINITY_DN17146_c0_g1_i1:122-1657(+)
METPSPSSPRDQRGDLMVPPGHIKYIVKREDTPAGIAIQHNTTVAQMLNLNRTFTGTVYTGQVLIVPDPSKSMKEEVREELPRGTIKFNARYATGVFHVEGIILIDPQHFTFQPLATDPIVIKEGTTRFQVKLDLADIFSCETLPGDKSASLDNLRKSNPGAPPSDPNAAFVQLNILSNGSKTLFFSLHKDVKDRLITKLHEMIRQRNSDLLSQVMSPPGSEQSPIKPILVSSPPSSIPKPGSSPTNLMAYVMPSYPPSGRGSIPPTPPNSMTTSFHPVPLDEDTPSSKMPLGSASRSISMPASSHEDTGKQRLDRSSSIGGETDGDAYAEYQQRKKEEEKFVPKMLQGQSEIIQLDDMIKIISWLPQRFQLSHWKLLYSTNKHGISINTFYHRCKNQGSCILVIEDTNHNVFGAFVSDFWRPQKGYYGTGETFVFTVKPTLANYHWSRMNNLFMLSDETSISLGGGGTFALWLDSDFLKGSTRECETWDNPPLTSQEQFTCLRLELWKVG